MVIYTQALLHLSKCYIFPKNNFTRLKNCKSELYFQLQIIIKPLNIFQIYNAEICILKNLDLEIEWDEEIIKGDGEFTLIK